MLELKGVSHPGLGNHVAGGEPLVFHCHHYNVALQKCMEEVWPQGVQELTRRSAQAVAHHLLSEVLLANGVTGQAERLAAAMEVHRQLGFGVLKAHEGGGTGQGLHYAVGWKVKHGLRTTPFCHFHAGFLAAAHAVAAGLPGGAFEATETACEAAGAPACQFHVRRTHADLLPSPGIGVLPSQDAPPFGNTGNIQAPAVLEALSHLPLVGNEDGLIPAFGVYLTRHFANHYNRVSFGFEDAVRARGTAAQEAARLVLVEAGHVCAFNTFGGIAMSAEWDAVLRPMVKDAADVFHGMVTVANALGWGCWRVVDLKPGVSAEVDVFASYESNGRLGMYGLSDHPVCYLHQGGLAGMMNLVWVADIASRPSLTDAFYDQLYARSDCFEARETRCRAMGHDRCTFVMERRRT